MISNKKKIRQIQAIGAFITGLIILFLIGKLVYLNNQYTTLKLEKKLYQLERIQVLDHFWESNFTIQNTFNLEINNDTILKSIAGDSHLGLWISDRQCASCVDFALSKLNELPDSIKDRIIVFSDYENPRIWKIVNEKISSRFNVICYQFSNKGSIYQTTFLGVLTPNFEIVKIFYPIKEIPILTDFYITKVVSNLQ